MQLKYIRPLILQVCAAVRAQLAEAGTTPEKEMELKRIAKVEKWMELREERDMTVKEAAKVVDEPPTVSTVGSFSYESSCKNGPEVDTDFVTNDLAQWLTACAAISHPKRDPKGY